MRLKLNRKNLLVGLSLLGSCCLAATALCVWVVGWIFLTDMLMNVFFCSEGVSTKSLYCGQTFQYGKVAVIVIVGVVLLTLFTQRVLKNFFFFPSDWSEKLKTDNRQKTMIEITTVP